MTDELGSRLERPIHFKCNKRSQCTLLHPAAAYHSVSISRQQVQSIFCFQLRSQVLLWLITTFGSSQTGLTVNVRNSSQRNKPSRAPPSTGTSQPVELSKEQAGPSRGYHLYSLVLTPVIGFRSLHRRVSQTFLGMMIRHRCHLLGG